MSSSGKGPGDDEPTRLENQGGEEAPTQIESASRAEAGGAQPLSDLGSDRLLRSLARSSHHGTEVPAIAGIHLLRKLGQGGMGAVYLGWKPLLRQHVAVKVLPLHLAELQPQMIDRFIREAQIAASIESPHLVRVIDVGEVEGLFYIVMEYVDGASAGALLRSSVSRRMEEADALDICVAACKGLAAAHARGVIHRDIKPDNILVPLRADGTADPGAARLADLGLARSEELGQSLTGTQAGMGTPGYMAPEQAMSAHKARKPADVFGLGATLYALVTGRSPFEGETSAATIMATIQQPHRPIREVNAAISEGTAALIDIALAKEPEDRYPDAAAMLGALETCRTALDGHADDVRAQVLALRNQQETGLAVRSTPPPGATVVATPPERSLDDPRRIRWIPILAGLVVAAIVIFAGWRLLTKRNGASTPAAAAPVELTILSSSDTQLWLPVVVEEFRKSPTGRAISIKVREISDRDAIGLISTGSERADAWFPSAALADEELHRMSGAEGDGPSVEDATLVTLSPHVILLFRSRYDALVQRYGQVTFAAMQQALESGTWERAASRPEWGRVSLAMTDPTRYSSGIISVLLLAAEIDHQDRNVSLEDLNDPRVIAALGAFHPAMNMTGDGAGVLREMILRGPSAWDGVVVSEAMAIAHIEQLEGRWEEVMLVYPHVNYWSDSTMFTISDDRRSDTERRALESFRDFLLSDGVQRELVTRGLRPANPAVGIRGEDSPFVRQLDSGVKIEVPIALDPPSHEVVEAIYSGYWKKRALEP